MNYSIGKPGKGKRVNFWDFINESGLTDYFKDRGITINPTHSYELLKPVRLNLFEKFKQRFIDDRTFNKLETTDTELKQFYLFWLQDELKVIEGWKSDTHPNGEPKFKYKFQQKNRASELIELGKYQSYVLSEIEATNQLLQAPNKPNHKADQDTPPPAITETPVFNPDIIEPVYNILKPHFVPEQHTQLNDLLTTGNTAGRLHFRSAGNRLADAFKQLIKAGLITGCTQIELETWIAQHFTYINNKTKLQAAFKQKYLNDIISTGKDKCQKPLLNVKIDNSTGKIQILRA